MAFSLWLFIWFKSHFWGYQPERAIGGMNQEIVNFDSQEGCKHEI